MTLHYQINTSKQTKSLDDKNDYQISFETWIQIKKEVNKYKRIRKNEENEKIITNTPHGKLVHWILT